MIVSSYEELKDLVYFGDDKEWFDDTSGEKERISAFLTLMYARQPREYSWREKNLYKFRSTSNTLYDFIHKWYANKDVENKDKDNEYKEYRYIRDALNKNVDEEMFALLRKYNNEFFYDKSLAFVGYRFSSGGDFKYKAKVEGDTLVIKCKYDTRGIVTTANNYELIAAEVDKNVNAIKKGIKCIK